MAEEAAPPARPRIALIHGLAESLAPCRAALAEHWPEAYAFDLLDSSLAADRAALGGLDRSFFPRIRTLYDYALSAHGGAGRTSAVLFTCSAFGPAIEAVQEIAAIPVLKPNECAFQQAIEPGGTVGLITTFAPSLPALEAELADMAAGLDASVAVRGACAAGALEALQGGDTAKHDALIVAAARSLGAVDRIVIGQFSAARAARAVHDATGLPVITTPDAAVRGLKKLVAIGTGNKNS